MSAVAEEVQLKLGKFYEVTDPLYVARKSFSEVPRRLEPGTLCILTEMKGSCVRAAIQGGEELTFPSKAFRESVRRAW